MRRILITVYAKHITYSFSLEMSFLKSLNIWQLAINFIMMGAVIV